MADSADRRSEGRNNITANKIIYNERKAAKVCALCGSVPVLNRAVCYSCSDKQSLRTKYTGFKKILENKLKEFNTTSEKLAEDLRDFSSPVSAQTRDVVLAILTVTKPAKAKQKIKPSSNFSKKCYEMRTAGIMPKQIAKIVQCTPNKVCTTIYHYKKKNKLS